MGLKLTPWFNGKIKPIRNGVYQREYDTNTTCAKIWYCMYKNGKWMGLESTPEDAKESTYISVYQNLLWRGILK